MNLRLLSENPEQYADAALQGIRDLRVSCQGYFVVFSEAARVDHVKMGIIVATNALLERKGERTALAITHHRDWPAANPANAAGNEWSAMTAAAKHSKVPIAPT